MSAAEIFQQPQDDRYAQLDAQKNLSDQRRDFLIDHIDRTEGLAIDNVRYGVDMIEGKHGPAFVDVYYFNNGLHYPTVTSIPKQQRTDIGVEIETAWGTSAKVNSHNGRTLGLYAAEGLPGVMFGPPRVELPKSIRRYAPSVIMDAYELCVEEVSMDADIAAYALISQDIYGNNDNSRSRYLFNGEYVVRYGESRGIMENLGSTAIGSLSDTKTLWLEGVDPCIPEELTVKELATDIKSIGELSAALTTMRHILTEARRFKYVDTVEPKLEYLIPALATRHTLFSGRTGDFAESLDEDAQGNIVLFDSSVANRYPVFMEKLEHAPHMNTELLIGGHLTLAAREMAYRSVVRTLAAIEAFQASGNDIFDDETMRTILGTTPQYRPKIKPSRKLYSVK